MKINKNLDLCIFFVTSRCNSRCSFCFYSGKLNKGNDLSLEEITKISGNLGRVKAFLFSGGEPFLREDLADIVRILVEQNAPEAISIPTNGLDTAGIIFSTEKILKTMEGKNVRFSVNLSIDAMETLDDKLRQAPKAFVSALETLKELGRLKRTYNNLNIAVNSVLSDETSVQFAELAGFIKDFDFVYNHNVEMVRPKTLAGYSGIRVDIGRLREAHLLSAFYHYLRLKKSLSLSRGPVAFLKALRSLVGQIGQLRYSQSIKEGFISGKRGLFICPAGHDVCVVESDGELKLCELTPAIGNLRENDYDVFKMLRTSLAGDFMRCINRNGCNCTHICFIAESIILGVYRGDPRVIFGIFYYFFKFLFFEYPFCSTREKEKCR